MYGNVFTLDYEIHGNGEGSPYELMVEPTDRLLNLFDQYGAKLTIMADIGEILKFKEYKQANGEDLFDYDKIIAQLIRAVKQGHDVQLHIHSSYFKSVFKDGHWQQDWSEYSLADLNYERLHEMIGVGKRFLEELIVPHKKDYRCFAFRAANWSMYPSKNIVKALIDHNIEIDTSVFKYGIRNEIVKFDYNSAYSDLIPWLVDADDVCKMDPQGQLLEIPIFCEQKNILSFISPNRIYRVIQASAHRHPKSVNGDKPVHDKPQKSSLNKISKLISLIRHPQPRKMDFNQCTGNQLISTMKRIERKHGSRRDDIPVVLIGHSKIFTKQNASSLRHYLRFIADNPKRYFFATFSDFDLHELKKLSFKE